MRVTCCAAVVLHEMFAVALRVFVVVCCLLQPLTDGVVSVPSSPSSPSAMTSPVILEGPPKSLVYSYRPDQRHSDTLTLPCLASSATSYYWVKDGRHLTTVTGNRGDLTLTLGRTTAGQYQCQAANHYGVAVSNITHLLPAVIEYRKSGDIGDVSHVVRGRLGNSAILPCGHVFSRPLAATSYRWLACKTRVKDNCQFDALVTSHTLAVLDTGELVLANVTSELAKWSYRCDVFNAQLRQRVTSNYVTIQLEGDGSSSSPSLLWASPSPSRVIAGDQVTLTCYFSVSTAVVGWQKDGVDVEPDNRLMFDPHRNQLTITKVTQTDAGSYTCFIEQDSDYVATDIALTVAVAPVITTSPQSVVTPPTHITTFHCVASGMAPLTISWLLNNVSISDVDDVLWYTSAEGSVLHLEQLAPLTTFTVTCNASNDVGYELAAATLTVTDMVTTTTRVTLPTTVQSTTSVVTTVAEQRSSSVDVVDSAATTATTATTATAAVTTVDVVMATSDKSHASASAVTNATVPQLIDIVFISDTESSKALSATMATALIFGAVCVVLGLVFLVVWLLVRRCRHASDKPCNRGSSSKNKGSRSYNSEGDDADDKLENAKLYELKCLRPPEEQAVWDEGDRHSPLAVIPLRRLEDTNWDADSGVFDHSVYSLATEALSDRYEDHS